MQRTSTYAVATALSFTLCLAGCVCATAGNGGGGRCARVECDPGEECEPESGDCVPVSCVPGRTRCSPLTAGELQRCNSTGDGWNRVGACGAEQGCVEEAAGAVCDPPACPLGTELCAADGRVQYCSAGAWEDPATCPSGEACDPAQGGCAPTVCGPNVTFCGEGGSEVLACNAFGTDSTVVQTCLSGETCNAGVCLNMCDLAELERSFVGCTYMALDANNDAYNDDLQYDIVVSNPQDGAIANVAVETRGPGGVWTAVATGIVPPGAVWVAPVPDRHAEGSGASPGLAYRITSDLPIVAYQYNSDDLDFASSSSGATLLFPKSALGTQHWIIGLPTVVATFGGQQNSSGFAVVGAFDGTGVTITPSTAIAPGDGVPALSPGETWSTIVNEGDVLQIEAAEIGDDPTGSLVVTDLPAAVFSYHEGAMTEWSFGFDDHYEEQLLPLETWGQTFPLARMYEPGDGSIWRILAAYDETTVTFQYAAGVTGLPAPSGSTVVLDAGEWQELVVGGPSEPPFPVGNANLGDFLVTADKPIEIAQFSFTETSMLIAVPFDQFKDEYIFVAPPFFEDTLTVIRYATSTVTLDGSPLPSAMFSDIVGGYQAYRQSLEDGSHRISGVAPSELEGPPGVHVTGDGGTCGYGYVGGLDLLVINPIQ